jgi:hypothetical protein
MIAGLNSPAPTEEDSMRHLRRSWSDERLRVRAAAALIAWLAAAHVAYAQAPVLYTDRSAWAAAAGGAATTIGFDGIAPAGGFTLFDTPSGLTLGGVNFVGSSAGNSTLPYYLRVVHPQFFPTYYEWGSGPVLHGAPDYVAPSGAGGPNSHIAASLPANVTAVGSDIMSFLQYASVFRIVVTTSGGASTFMVPTAANPTRAFAGFVSTSPITAIRFQAINGFPVLDNFAMVTGGGPPTGGAPTNLVATVSGTTVDFAWTAPVGPAPTGYIIEASLAPGGAPIASVSVPGTSARVTNVPTGTFFIRVRAVYPGGTSQPSSTVQIVVGGGPPPTMVLTVTRPSARIGEHVTFSWTDQVLGPGAQYTIFVAGPGSSTFTPLTFAPCCILGLDVPPAPAGVYSLYVRAPNGVQSNTVTLQIVP